MKTGVTFRPEYVTFHVIYLKKKWSEWVSLYFKARKTIGVLRTQRFLLKGCCTLDMFGREHGVHDVVSVRPQGVVITLGELSMRCLCPLWPRRRLVSRTKQTRGTKGGFHQFTVDDKNSAVGQIKNMFCKWSLNLLLQRFCFCLHFCFLFSKGNTFLLHLAVLLSNEVKNLTAVCFKVPSFALFHRVKGWKRENKHQSCTLAARPSNGSLGPVLLCSAATYWQRREHLNIFHVYMENSLQYDNNNQFLMSSLLKCRY